jgi:PAS domain S-box-containing protein
LTESKLAEQALRESERKYRLLMEQASDGILTADEYGNFIEVNQKACEMLGYNSSEFLSLNIKDLISAEDLSIAPLQLREVTDGLTVRTERRLRRKDGSLIDVEISAKMIEGRMLQAIGRDIF